MPTVKSEDGGNEGVPGEKLVDNTIEGTKGEYQNGIRSNILGTE